MRHPLYIDGPLAGQDNPVDDNAISVYAGDPGELLDGGQPTRYNFTQYGFHSNGETVIFLVAHLTEKPGAEALAEYALSDAAKRARIA
ncbi:MAG TPA: hypothetical protein VGR71_16810 [Nitrospira sp.]|nr:hypothetical protein [Nitrospira sp.]